MEGVVGDVPQCLHKGTGLSLERHHEQSAVERCHRKGRPPVVQDRLVVPQLQGRHVEQGRVVGVVRHPIDLPRNDAGSRRSDHQRTVREVVPELGQMRRREGLKICDVSVAPVAIDAVEYHFDERLVQGVRIGNGRHLRG